MKIIKFYTILFFGILFASCSQQQQARKPISHRSGTFIKESINRNKELLALEKKQIDSIIKADSLHNYIASSKGYWYKYLVKVNENLPVAKSGDIASFEFEIKTLNGNIIYTKEELRPQTYVVDKQNIMMGLRDGIKLMKKGETVTFLFPSYMAFGYHGDNDEIGTNQPLMCTVTLNNLQPETSQKSEN